jgi:RNA recognition motif-containing protein
MWRQLHHNMTNHEDRTVNIYVSNLAYVTTEDELSELFAAYGAVERVQIITDRETGRSRRFAFVEMPNAIQARVAIAELNRMELGGRTLAVQEARPRDERNGGRRGSRRPR